MKWTDSDQKSSYVVKATVWRMLSKYKNLEDRAGVYIFANSAQQVKYVGKAGARRIVEEIGSAIRREKDAGATLVKVLYTNSDSNALTLERKLINKYNPPNNLR